MQLIVSQLELVMPVVFRKDATLTLRIDARTRYALDLLSRVKRRSVSELVVDQLRKLVGEELSSIDVAGTATPLVDAVWDVFAPDRLVKLAMHAPELLTDDEAKVWRVISEDETYLPKRGKPDFASIRRDWVKIQKKVREYEAI